MSEENTQLSCPTPPTNGLIAGFTTEYDASSNKLYERLLASEGRSSLYPDRDSIDRLLEVERGVIEEPAEGEAPTEIEVPIMVEGLKESITYELDGVGNWLKTESIVVEEDGETSKQVETREPNSLNQYKKLSSGEKNEGLSYDKNGNLLSDSKHNYFYDVFNRLRQVKRKSDEKMIAEYFYDAMGRRVSKRVAEYDKEGELEELGPTSFLSENWQVYDSLSRVLIEYQQVGSPTGRPTINPPRQTRTVQTSRFDSFVPTETIYPAGRKVYTGYDQLYRMVSMSEEDTSEEGGRRRRDGFGVRQKNGQGGETFIPTVPIGLWEFFGPSRIARMQQGESILTTYMNDQAKRSAVQSADEVPQWGDAETDRLGYDGAGRPIAKRIFASEDPPIAVRIESSEPLPNEHNRWKYYVRLMAWDVEAEQWVRTDDNEEPLEAYNTVEANNGEFGIQGSGDNIPSYRDDEGDRFVDLPEGHAMQPIGRRAIIQGARIKINCTGDREVYFTAPNNISQNPQ